MTEGDIISIVRQVVRQELSPILMGQTISNESEIRSTVKRFPNESPRANIRSVLPFGIASRAPAGMDAFLIPAGFDPTNLNIVGHYDPARPRLNDGDLAIYDAHGHVLYLSSGKIQLGTESSSENLVLGQQLKTLLTQLLTALATHTHAGPGAPPTNAAEFETLKASPVQDEGILSKISFTE